MGVWISFQITVVSSGKYLEMELLDHMAVLFFNNFEELPYYFPQWLNWFTFPPTVHKSSLFSTPSSTLVISWLFDDNHSDRRPQLAVPLGTVLSRSCLPPGVSPPRADGWVVGVQAPRSAHWETAGGPPGTRASWGSAEAFAGPASQLLSLPKSRFLFLPDAEPRNGPKKLPALWPPSQNPLPRGANLQPILSGWTTAARLQAPPAPSPLRTCFSVWAEWEITHELPRWHQW